MSQRSWELQRMYYGTEPRRVRMIVEKPSGKEASGPTPVSKPKIEFADCTSCGISDRECQRGMFDSRPEDGDPRCCSECHHPVKR